jgi:hypothetical protein
MKREDREFFELLMQNHTSSIQNDIKNIKDDTEGICKRLDVLNGQVPKNSHFILFQKRFNWVIGLALFAVVAGYEVVIPLMRSLAKSLIGI